MTAARRDYAGVAFGFLGLLALALILRSDLLWISAGLFGLTALVTILWGRYALERVDYTRRFARHRCFVGEELELRVEMANRKVLPVTYLTVEDTVPNELQIRAKRLQFARVGKGRLRLVFGMGWYQKVIRHYEVVPTRRGFYRLGPALMTGGDPFGFIRQKREIAEPEELIVYPRVLPLEALGIASHRPFGDLRSRNRLFEDPMRIAGVREYQPGDPPNRVHWKATAASGRLQVKQLDPSSNLGMAVFLNAWGFDLFWQGIDVDAFETGCVVAASLAGWAAEREIPFGLYANAIPRGWGINLRLPPATGSEVLSRALEGLARLWTPSRESVADLMLDEMGHLGYGTSVVVITRQVGSALLEALDRVHRSGRPVTVIQVGRDVPELPALPGMRVYHVPEEVALDAGALA